MAVQSTPLKVLGLDVGDKRVGVALCLVMLGIAQPLVTLDRNEVTIQEIKRICDEEAIETIVVGVPRGLNGQDTNQTAKTLAFIAELEARLTQQVIEQDEALTSVQAEAWLNQHKKTYEKADIDAVAARLILQDYIDQLPKAGNAV
jgi:putative Holliday junction resolvase